MGGHPQLRLVIPEKGMSQKDYDRRVRDLAFFSVGFGTALVTLAWLTVG